MPMVPGLSANMPSRVSLEDDAFSASLSESYFFDDMLFGDYSIPLGGTDIPEQIFDDDMYNSSSFSQETMNPCKRDCLFGKPEDQCLRECGPQCDAFVNYQLRHFPFGSNNVVIANSAEDLRLVNPQVVLPQDNAYYPLSEHCYHVNSGQTDSDLKQTNCYETESPSEESADEIVDVETVQDKVEPPVNKVVKKRGRKPVRKFKFSNPKPAALNNKRTTVVKRGNKIMQSGRVTKGRRRGKSSCEPSSASSSDAEENGKRSNHNNMERHRRDEQKRMLQGLRVLIPAIKGNPKTPKVMILTEAAKFIFQLRSQNSHLEQAMLNEKEKQRRYLRIKKELTESISRS